MINGYSIRKCAKEVKISIPTSFYWRHKILDAIRAFMGIGSVGGVIEVDEAIFRESFKGDHKKSTTFTMPRKAHKRGVKGSYSSKDEKRKRGISKEQVCVLCAWIEQETLLLNLYAKEE
jgi:transposase